MTDNIQTEDLEEQHRKERERLREHAENVQATTRGITAGNLAQAVDFGRTMATSKSVLPPHLRGSHGDCTGIISTALVWGMDPYMLGRMTYFVNGQMQFYAALVHARLRMAKVLRHSLDVQFEGEGDDRVCIVTGYLETDPEDMALVYRSPPKRVCRSRSTLWDTDPDSQLTYMSQKRWVNLKCPEVMLGLFPEHEEEEPGEPSEGEGEILEASEFGPPRAVPEPPPGSPEPEPLEPLDRDGQSDEDAAAESEPKKKKRAKTMSDERFEQLGGEPRSE